MTSDTTERLAPRAAAADHPDAKLLGWEAEIVELEEAMDDAHDDEEISRLDDQVVKLEWRIARAHAKGFVGLAVKVRRLRKDMEAGAGDWSEENVCVVLDDLEILSTAESTSRTA